MDLIRKLGWQPTDFREFTSLPSEIRHRDGYEGKVPSTDAEHNAHDEMLRRLVAYQASIDDLAAARQGGKT